MFISPPPNNLQTANPGSVRSDWYKACDTKLRGQVISYILNYILTKGY